MKPLAGVPALLDQNQQDYASQVAKAFGLQSRVPGHLDPRLQLGLTVDDLTKLEFAWLRRRTSWESWATRAALAAQQGYAQLKPAVGIITTVNRVVITNTTASTATFRIGLAILNAETALAPMSPLDDRLVTGGTPAAVVSSGTNAAPIIPAGLQVSVPTVTTLVLDVDYVFLGGRGPAAPPFDGLAAVCLQVNTQIDVSFRWQERVALPSEF